MICAEDKCRMVEGDEVCEEELVENSVNVPEETCVMEPETVCKNETVALPQLIPKETCRVVPRYILLKILDILVKDHCTILLCY